MAKKIGSNSYHTLLQCTGLLSEIKIMNEFEHWKRKYTDQRGKQVKIKKFPVSDADEPQNLCLICHLLFLVTEINIFPLCD